MGELCEITDADGKTALSEVIGLDNDVAQLMPYHKPLGLRLGADVVALRRKLRVPVGEELLGRTLDGMGNPLDGKGRLATCQWREVTQNIPDALNRPEN